MKRSFDDEFAKLDFGFFLEMLAFMATEEEQTKTPYAGVINFPEEAQTITREELKKLARLYVEVLFDEFDALENPPFSSDELLTSDYRKIAEDHHAAVYDFRMRCAKKARAASENPVSDFEDKYLYQTGKLPADLWQKLSKETNKQISIFDHEIPTGTNEYKRGAAIIKQEAVVFVSMDYSELDNLKISREMTAFDRAIYDAVCSLFYKANKTNQQPIFTAQQILFEAGMTAKKNGKLLKTVSAQDREKVYKSLMKMNAAQMMIVTAGEMNNDKFARYDMFEAHGSFLPNVFGAGSRRGQYVKEAVKILDMPFLLRYAVSRNMYAHLPIAVMQTPIQKTERNLKLEQYLRRSIEIMKQKTADGKGTNRKILLSTLAKIGGVQKKHIERLKTVLADILEYWKRIHYIEKYSITDTSVSIYPVNVIQPLPSKGKKKRISSKHDE